MPRGRSRAGFPAGINYHQHRGGYWQAGLESGIMRKEDPGNLPTRAAEFMTRVKPAFTRGDLPGALRELQAGWNTSTLIRFLNAPGAEIRKTAAMSLTLVGDKSAVEALARALHDGDADYCHLIEHALWAIWFRSGNFRSIRHLQCGLSHLQHGNLDTAAEKFSLAIEADPDFAEAYNQRAIAYYLAERFEESIRDCQRTLERMPPHFGAMAGMGHSHAHLGRLPAARECYRRALDIHPRMEGIAASLAKIEDILKRDND